MAIHSFGGRARSACGATFAALLLAAAVPLAAPTAAEAQQQQGPSHMQREMPAAQAQRQQLPPSPDSGRNGGSLRASRIASPHWGRSGAVSNAAGVPQMGPNYSPR